MPEYYHTLNSLCIEFDILTLLHACTSTAHEGVLKHNQLVTRMQFLMRLNDVYQPVRSNLLARDPLPDVKDAFTIVPKDESHKGLAPGKQSVKNMPAAFVVKTNNNNSNRRVNTSNNNNKGPNPNLVCKHCGLIGHTIEKCYELNGYPVRFKRNPNLPNFTNEQKMKLLSLINEKPATNVSGSMAEYNVSMLSVNKMIKDSKYFVSFDEHKCYIQDLKLAKILGTGSESGGLYMFDYIDNGKLGHPADQLLSILGDKLGFKTSDHVSACDISFDDRVVEKVKDEVVAIATQIEDNVTSKGNNQNISTGEGSGNSGNESQIEVRRSSRHRTRHVKFNDFFININVKYGLEKHVCYSNLSSVNYCFSTTLNKFVCHTLTMAETRERNIMINHNTRYKIGKTTMHKLQVLRRPPTSNNLE
ncbi:hypothetical protein Tco_0122174 [Tanacetum coccineum]